jgi:hypothetical protein
MTSETVELKRVLRTSELAFLAGKKRQSPRTGFVHLFHGNDLAADTIPIYENICYALALLSQKKTEPVLEAKNLLSRLFPFQPQEGNFPIYLHDFPRCYDIFLGLKIAPLLLKICFFKSVLGKDFIEKVEAALHKIFSFYQDKDLLPLWEFRLAVCRAVFLDTPFRGQRLDTVQFSAADWWEYWISLQFIETPVCDFYHPGLQMAMGFDLKQDRFEPAPRLIDWISAEEFHPRLLQDRPTQIQLIALDKVEILSNDRSEIYFEDGNVFWLDGGLHSLVADNISLGVAELPASLEMGRDDLFEAAYYCDASLDIEIFIDGRKGTVFTLGQTITVRSARRNFSLVFELLRGEGDFCGHVFRSNRPGQIGTTGTFQHEAFDWKIGLRTLRRSSDCAIRVQLLEAAEA